MAKTTVPESVCIQQTPELRIEIWRDSWAVYEGTAAQLTAEGLIPSDFKWPQGKGRSYWKANGFDYWLCRKRPAEHKGGMSSWLEIDNWHINIQVSGRDHRWHERRSIERKAEELKAAMHRLSPAGKAEDAEALRVILATVGDRAFQAFKAKVPALNPPRRTRKPKTADRPARSA
jgi:hypothetical protein